MYSVVKGKKKSKNYKWHVKQSLWKKVPWCKSNPRAKKSP